MNSKLQDEFVARMQATCFTGDKEANHGEADRLLVELLERLGYNDLVELYTAVGGWYA